MNKFTTVCDPSLIKSLFLIDIGSKACHVLHTILAHKKDTCLYVVSNLPTTMRKIMPPTSRGKTVPFKTKLGSMDGLVLFEKTLECTKCFKHLGIDCFWSKDVENKRGVLRVKKGRNKATITCNDCGNNSDKSKSIIKARKEQERKDFKRKWFNVDDQTFEEHCKMLGEGLHTPWLCSFEENLGRSFTDVKCVPWSVIIERTEYYKRKMMHENPARYNETRWDKEHPVRMGIGLPIVEHEFKKIKF